MFDQARIDKIDFHLIRVLHTVLTERSVSRAALLLDMHQPAVSGALKRLREITGDALLVRAGAAMVPTDVGIGMIEPCAAILRSANALFDDARRFDPATDRGIFRVSASDYLGAQILPQLVIDIKAQAPHCRLEFHPLIDRGGAYAKLACGDLDAALMNWYEPQPDLHGAALFDDEVVCMVSSNHPAAREGWTVEGWLAAEHLVSVPLAVRSGRMIDEHLERLGLVRNCAMYFPHFALIPEVVARTSFVMTAGRGFCDRVVGQLPLTILPCPIEFPRMSFFQIWHERTHQSARAQWLRAQIQRVASDPTTR